jgi:hypothetical protein
MGDNARQHAAIDKRVAVLSHALIPPSLISHENCAIYAQSARASQAPLTVIKGEEHLGL